MCKYFLYFCKSKLEKTILASVKVLVNNNIVQQCF